MVEEQVKGSGGMITDNGWKNWSDRGQEGRNKGREGKKNTAEQGYAVKVGRE